MDTRREADELTSRCVALVVFHRGLARQERPDWGAINSEFRAVAAEAEAKGIPPVTIVAQVLTALHDRFESEAARRLHREFIAGFSEEVGVELATA